jgi:hypothetical protein
MVRSLDPRDADDRSRIVIQMSLRRQPSKSATGTTHYCLRADFPSFWTNHHQQDVNSAQDSTLNAEDAGLFVDEESPQDGIQIS